MKIFEFFLFFVFSSLFRNYLKIIVRNYVKFDLTVKSEEPTDSKAETEFSSFFVYFLSLNKLHDVEKR